MVCPSEECKEELEYNHISHFHSSRTDQRNRVCDLCKMELNPDQYCFHCEEDSNHVQFNKRDFIDICINCYVLSKKTSEFF